jgi:RNA polymerase sigma factor (sigma-70 family)
VTDAGPNRVESLLRELAPRVLGSVVRRFRDFAACEDAVQEALLAAATKWPSEGMPDDPRAWLIRVAARRVTDHIRSEVARRRREEVTASQDDDAAPAPDDDRTHERDDSLALLFMCCHPALTTSSAIALTLRAIGGLTTAEIARAFLVPEATMAQRISRAKQSIQESNVPFELPSPQESVGRLVAVMHVLYLTFSEGYTASSGSALQRVDLSTEAIRLTRMLHDLLPPDGEVQGLLALMLLTDARRDARSGPAGELIPLDRQDRSAWNRAVIAEGVALVSAALSKGSIGSYQLQAAIAAVHDEAPSADATDWPQILALYGLLQRVSDNPMVALNHAIAFAMVHGPESGLKAMDELAGDPRLAGSHRLDAVRAHLLERAERPGEAVEYYRRSAARTSSTPERNYLLTQAARLNDKSREGRS